MEQIIKELQKQLLAAERFAGAGPYTEHRFDTLKQYLKEKRLETIKELKKVGIQ